MTMLKICWIIISVCTLMVHGYEETSSPSTECLVNYLKTQKVTDDYFDSVDELPKNKMNDCNLTIMATFENIENGFFKQHSKHPDMKCAYEDCCNNKAFQNMKLKAEVLDRVQVYWKFWNYFQKGSQIDALKEKTEKLAERSFFKCKMSEECGDIFDFMFNTSLILSMFDGGKDYCVREYLVKKKMLNPDAYHFELNPESKRNYLINCHLLINNLIDGSSRNSAKTPKCVEVYKSSKLADYILKAEVLAKLNLSDQVKSVERKSFVDSMTSIMYELNSQNC